MSWLDSIPQYPKGYDFKFSEIHELLDINFRNYQNQKGTFTPCWELDNLENGPDCPKGQKCMYTGSIKNEDGSGRVEEKRKCLYKDIEDFQHQMDRRRLSLKRAIDVYAKTGGRSTQDLTVKGGTKNCEQKNNKSKIDYTDLINGKSYEISFDMLYPVGSKIGTTDTHVIAFKLSQWTEDNLKKTGRWVVDSSVSKTASQRGQKMELIVNEKKVNILGAVFTYKSDDTGNFLEWTREDCIKNMETFGYHQGSKSLIINPTI